MGGTQTEFLTLEYAGGDKLRFTRDLLNPETRIEQVRRVVGWVAE